MENIKMKSEFEVCIHFALEDFESKINNKQVTENKLLILFEEEIKDEVKHTTKKWLFIGVVLGMALLRILEFILPNG